MFFVIYYESMHEEKSKTGFALTFETMHQKTYTNGVHISISIFPTLSYYSIYQTFILPIKTVKVLEKITLVQSLYQDNGRHFLKFHCITIFSIIPSFIGARVNLFSFSIFSIIFFKSFPLV